MDASKDASSWNYVHGLSGKRKTRLSLILTTLLGAVALVFLYQASSAFTHTPDVPPPDSKTIIQESIQVPEKVDSVALTHPSHDSASSNTSSQILAKVTMAYGTIDETYEMAIETQRRHALGYNYGMYILRENVMSGYWSKTFYLMALLIEELAKPLATRRKWLMWFDADCMILNSNIPLDLFLPNETDPLYDDVRLIFARDDYGLNTGVFFLRVRTETIQILADAYAWWKARPDEDFGRVFDQIALESVLPVYNQSLLFMPRAWFNIHYYYFVPGIMAGHFYLDGDRKTHMSDWYDKVNDPNDLDANWPIEKTFYAKDVKTYWDLVTELRQLITKMEGVIEKTVVEGDKAKLQEIHGELVYIRIWDCDDINKMMLAISNAKWVMSQMPSTPAGV